MRILDRYILKSILSIFIGSLMTFFFLYVIIDLFSHLDTIIREKVSLDTVLQYYLSYLPVIFSQVSPISCLLATLYTFSTLNRDNEIIAMRASGMSIMQISNTVIIMGFVLSIFIFLVNDKLVPQSLMISQKIKQSMEKPKKDDKNKKSEIIENLAIYGAGNRLFFINKFNTTDNSMEGITILEDDEFQRNIKKVVADSGYYRDGLWRFQKSITYNFDEKSQIKGEPQYMEDEIMAISETPKDFMNQKQMIEYMTLAQLYQYIWRLSKTGATGPVKNAQIELYQRFTSPFTSLIIILIGIPFSLKVKKRATGLSSLGLVFILVFFYYILNGICLALGKTGFLYPIIAVTMSHLIVLGVGVYMLNKLP